MDQKPNLDLVYLAIQALYNNNNKERASQWLEELQKSVSKPPYKQTPTTLTTASLPGPCLDSG